MSPKCFLVLISILIVVKSDQCPNVCQCKWKNGKRTVECIDRALISIPKEIDIETQVLDLSGNNLQILPAETFHKIDLLNLQKLYLRSCRIGQIETDAFKGLTNLIELDLSYNLLTRIPTDSFRSVPFLRDLILTHNPISKLERNAFNFLTNLIKLDLSNCQLKEIASEAFDNIESLELLKLNGNKLQELQPKAIEKFQRLHSIDLYNNPWLCDCGLRGIKEWLLVNNMPFLIAPICRSGPDHVIGKSFSELDIDDFACKPEMLPISRFVEATVGENASIVCRIGAVPSAFVKWYWNGRLLLNNTVFSLNQRIQIDEYGRFEKRSRLILTNAQLVDSGEFFCIAENRAGNTEANFTLRVTYPVAGMASLTNGHIAGISAALVMLFVCVTCMVFILAMRLKQAPFNATGGKTNGPPAMQRDNTNTGPMISIDSKNQVLESPAKQLSLYSPSSGSVNPDLINDTKLSTYDFQQQQQQQQQQPQQQPQQQSSMQIGNLPPPYPDARQYYLDYPQDYGLPIVHNIQTVNTMDVVSPMSNPKTLRVWQKGGVPVLPPVSAAFKRAFYYTNRNSPDEGYQEGNTTDV